MVAYHLKGYITESGELKLELPEDIAPGEVEVTIAPVFESNEDVPLTEEEIREILSQPAMPKSGAEIVTRIRAEGGGWDPKTTPSGAEWVDEQRRKLGERVQWSEE